jgi:phenylalanyl-tRNA synthetase alpha chain
MTYQIESISNAAVILRAKLSEIDNPKQVGKFAEFSVLQNELKNLPAEERAEFGKELNALKAELEGLVMVSAEGGVRGAELGLIDVTAPMDVNSAYPELLPADKGTIHPLTRELNKVLDIFGRMGFASLESRSLDDDYHMFTSLNFPEGHPARDEWDTFLVEGDLVAPAHTSNMQNRVISSNKAKLEAGEGIRFMVPGRVFRNEDVDARHEHTFLQIEGICVDKGINAGHLVTTFKTFLEAYYEKPMEVKLQPFYFPFTEPSFEFVLTCPFCDKKGCNICSQSGWIELGGSGMIHPNVLKMAGVDPNVYTGFAWGFGFERLVMMKFGVEDIRHFNSGKLEFLRQFKGEN